VKTLTLEEAADFLKMHPMTVQEKARSGEIPAAKPGRRWVFIDVDLVEYLRSQYSSRALQGDTKEMQTCHSTSERARPITGSMSATVDAEYSKALGLPTKQKRGSTTTG
jgi:excisionase family DNA binding protein